MAEWSKALAWKVSIRQKRIEGSNPSRSAKHRRLPHKFADYLLNYQPDMLWHTIAYVQGFSHALPPWLKLFVLRTTYCQMPPIYLRACLPRIFSEFGS